MTQHQTISKENIERIAGDIESLKPDETVAGVCKDASIKLIREMTEEYTINPTLFKFQMGSNRETHYAIVLKIKYFDTESLDRRYSPNEHIIIDPTIRQFSTENYQKGIVGVSLDSAENLPFIGFYPPRCRERMRWYNTNLDNRDDRDVLSQISVEDTATVEQPSG